MATYRTEPLPDAPYSVDVLADLHAGVLSESVSDRLWPLVSQDESAMTVISALDDVSTRLAEVGREHAVGEPMPPAVAERIDRALAAADTPYEPADTLDHPADTLDHPADALELHAFPVSRRRRRTVGGVDIGVGIGVAATIAVAIALTAAVLTSSMDGRSEVVADGSNPAQTAPTLVLESDDIDASFAYRVMANRGEVPLFESGVLAECLSANGIGSASTVLGAAPVELDGRSGVVLVLPRDDGTGGLTLLAVAPDCAAGNPATLLRRDLD